MTATLAVAPKQTSALTRDDAIERAERAVYRHYGLHPSMRRVRLDTGAGHADVRLTEFGQDEKRPPVVLLHGIGSANVLAAPLLPAFQDRRVIAVDWPGHGLSGACVLPQTLAVRTHAVTTLASLLDALHVEQVDLVGHSMGAQFSLYAALDLGSRVRRIALLGAPGAALLGVRPIPVMKALAIPGIGRPLLSAPMPERTFRRNQDLVLGRGALAQAPADLLVALYLLAGRRLNAASIASFFRALIRRGSIRKGVQLSLDELGRIRQPVLFVWGDGDVFLTPLAGAASVVAVRDVRLLRLPTAGHAPWLQAQAAVSIAVAAHLTP